MTDEEHMLPLLVVGRVTIHQNLANRLSILHTIEQRGAHPNTVEERAHLLYLLPQTVHLNAINDIRRLNLHRSDTLATQSEQRLGGSVFSDALLGQTVHYNTRGVCLAHYHVRKFLTSLFVDGINGLLTGIIIGGAKVNH